MPGSVGRRSTTTRDQHRAVLRRGKPPCGICHQDIDYRLPHLDPGEYVVDHIIPLAKDGLDVLENKQPAHRSCNERKADIVAGEVPINSGPRIFVTERTW